MCSPGRFLCFLYVPANKGQRHAFHVVLASAVVHRRRLQRRLRACALLASTVPAARHTVQTALRATHAHQGP